MLALVVLVGGFAVSVAGGVAAGKAPARPSVPRCSSLSVKAISKLVGVGKLYLDHTRVHGTSCDYYGWSQKQVDNPPDVASNKIKYVPSLLISVIPATRTLYYDYANRLREEADNQRLHSVGLSPKLGLGKEARFYYGVITDSKQPACSTGILENNWTGPAACRPQPGLEKVSVIAYRGSNNGLGLVVTVSAAQEYPSHLQAPRLARLAKDALAGHIA